MSLRKVRPLLSSAAILAAGICCFLLARKLTAGGVPPHRAAASRTFEVCGSSIQVDILSGPLDLPPDDIFHWVQNAAESVATYYGKFPVAQEHVQIEVSAGDDGVMNGRTWGGMPTMAHLTVGEHVTAAQLDDDWTMTHEFVHTAMPDLAERHHWIEEGLAVYVEPIARVQDGKLSADRVWHDLVRDMRQGEPAADARGLDHERSWASTYWGGALFFFAADIEIREKTHNRKSLQDGLRAILAAGESIQNDGTPEKAFAIADKGIGVEGFTPLQDRYQRMRDAPVAIDLDGIWHKLGIHSDQHGRITYDDSAPDAYVRKDFFKGRESCMSAGKR